MATGKYNGLCFDQNTDSIIAKPDAKPEEVHAMGTYVMTGKITPPFEQGLNNAGACTKPQVDNPQMFIPHATQAGFKFNP